MHENPFLDHPAFQSWWESIEDAWLLFEAEAEQAISMDGDPAHVHFLNALTRFFLALGEANEAIGIPFSRAEIRSNFLKCWPTRDISVGEARAIATGIAYEQVVRLPDSGTNDSRMDAARLAAAHLEGLTSSDANETVRTSIRRFRKKVRGTKVVHLDRETLMTELVDAEDALLNGLPRKSGRPRT